MNSVFGMFQKLFPLVALLLYFSVFRATPWNFRRHGTGVPSWAHPHSGDNFLSLHMQRHHQLFVDYPPASFIMLTATMYLVFLFSLMQTFKIRLKNFFDISQVLKLLFHSCPVAQEFALIP